MHGLGHLSRLLKLRREIEQMAPMPGSHSAPKSFSTMIMIGGFLAAVIGLYAAIPVLLLGGGAAIVLGLIMAFLGAILDVVRKGRGR